MVGGFCCILWLKSEETKRKKYSAGKMEGMLLTVDSLEKYL